MRTVYKVKNKEDIFSLIDSIKLEKICGNQQVLFLSVEAMNRQG